MGCCQSEDLSNYSPIERVCYRLNDRLVRFNTDEDAIIDILTGKVEEPEAIGELELRTWLQTQLVPTYGRMYSALADDIDKNCSGNFKKALLALLQPDTENLAIMLYNAMKGLGTDEFSLTAVCCTLPASYIEKIKEIYRVMYERSLVEHIESEVSGNLKKVLVMSASMTRGEAYAKVCYDSIKGLGTDERSLIRILTTATIDDVIEMNKAYQYTYNKTLQQDIEGDTSGSFKNLLLALSTRHSIEACDPEADAQALRDACEGLGTDEQLIIQTLANKTEDQIAMIKDAYRQKFNGEELKDRLKSETTGLFESSDFRECLAALCEPRFVTIANYLRKAMKGWGTDEAGLIMLLVHRSSYERDCIRKEYANLFQRDLIGDIRADCSGDFEDALVALIDTIPNTIAKAIYYAMKGFGTNNATLISMLCASTEIMPAVRQSFERQFQKSMIERIKSELGGDYENVLVAIANYDPPKFELTV
mmetsp:Transcript_39770/g.52432  ORF Transcript_39770/g.52432 Transcript_39770/m.52432 type:complete len:478 (+) Transcript_39770:163-1596(+)|eukprot:CAMPEP_0117756308 /NCGR_PEP_ID=MMETSP0947-20121206/13996_1 /TAXON_ID=44440 /ORGANISM="Chattonella subsalsa, Strain CCMP2191" /LENGTH=477 /DNA_ID=CAMNT_0005575861 /DNA_START=143 /DNA_END=1576 /DNA_ORIENTATION=+